MQTQLVITAQSELIGQLKTVVEGFITQYSNKQKSATQLKIEIVQPIIAENYEKVVEDDKLFGMFSHYVTHRISDEEMEEAIVQGASERAMRGIHD
nr:hypothetical protein [uncultured Moraxella sp.]